MGIVLPIVLAIMNFLVNSAHLQAATTGPSTATGDDGADPICQTCCPGPTAVLGIPGMPGQAGPSGQKGDMGRGEKGDTGEPGETPMESRNLVAFTVTRTSSMAVSSSQTTRLTFDEATTRLPGTDFDLETGTFTCNVPGVYVFMFSGHRYTHQRLTIHLYKNDDRIVSGESASDNTFDQVPGSAVLTLQQGDRVYLTYVGRAYSRSTAIFIAFSGFLL